MSDTSPVNDPPRQCEAHQEACAPLSSLEECAACVGPVAADNRQELECKSDIDTSDTEEVDGGSDSDDEVDVCSSGSSSSECMDAAAECSATDQARDTEDCNASLAPVESSGQGPAPVCEESDTDAEPDRTGTRSRLVKRKQRWSEAEVATVMRHFAKHIEAGKRAGGVECSRCKLAEAPLLNRRSAQSIRDYVTYRVVKRQAQKE